MQYLNAIVTVIQKRLPKRDVLSVILSKVIFRPFIGRTPCADCFRIQFDYLLSNTSLASSSRMTWKISEQLILR